MSETELNNRYGGWQGLQNDLHEEFGPQNVNLTNDPVFRCPRFVVTAPAP